MTHNPPRILAFLALGLFLACPESARSAPLANPHNWVLASWIKDGKEGKALPGTTLKAGKNQLAGSTGVNSYAAKYALKSNQSLRVRDLSVTEIAGPPELMAQEATFLEILNTVEQFTINENHLTLKDAQGTNALNFTTAQPEPAEPLRGTQWALAHFESIEGEAVKMTPLAPNTSITFTIDDAGKVSGSGGVNRYFATAEIEGKQISIGRVGATRRAGPPEAMKQEQAYFNLLSGNNSYSIDGDRLTLASKDGTKKLVFKAR